MVITQTDINHSEFHPGMAVLGIRTQAALLHCSPTTEYFTLKHAKLKLLQPEKSGFYIDLPGSEGRWRQTAGHFTPARCSQVKCGDIQPAISFQAVLVAPPSDLFKKSFGVGYHR